MNTAAIDLRLLRSFIATARLGSVTRAADLLHLTQPALSQHLRELRGLMGVQLLDRVGRGVALTPAGIELFGLVEPLLEDLDTALASVHGLSREVKGRLRIGAIDTYSRALVIPAVAELLVAHPELKVSIEEMPAAQIDRALIENEIDIGLAFSNLSSPDINQCTLFEEVLALIRLRADDDSGGARVSMQELAGMRLALLNRNFAMRRQIDSAFSRAGLPLDVRVEAANVDSLVRLVDRGDWVIIASPLAIDDVGRFEVRQIDHGDLSRIAALRWRRGRSFSAATLAFNHVLMGRLQRLPGIRLSDEAQAMSQA
ncbi:LysR substrate-binding domain-containing protein [Pseudomonas gingeri]